MVTVAATVVVSAQTPTGSSQNRQSTFRATAEGVNTTLRVINSRGQFVPDLTIDEIRLFEDDVEQKLTVFAPWIGGRNMAPAIAAPPPVADGLILPPARAATDESGRIFIIFIDDLHLQSLDTPRVRHVLKMIRDELIHEGDLVGLVSSGYSSISVDLNYDYGNVRFNESISKVSGSALSPFEILQMNESSEGPQGLRYAAHTAFDLAREMLETAAKITNRRKSFIYVSSGYDFNPFEDARYKLEQERYGLRNGTLGEGESTDIYRDPFEKMGQQFADSDLVGEIAYLTRAAQRANVIFYTVDPRGLLAGPDLNTELSITEWDEYNRTALSSLRVLADETGGFCICNTNDFQGGLRRIDAETSDYYMIGYNSTNPDPLRVRRAIRIEITREGDYDLVYKREYTLDRSESGPASLRFDRPFGYVPPLPAGSAGRAPLRRNQGRA
jgi:VWFA-related protein